MTKNFSEETEQDEGKIKVRKSRKGFTLCEQKKKNGVFRYYIDLVILVSFYFFNSFFPF